MAQKAQRERAAVGAVDPGGAHRASNPHPPSAGARSPPQPRMAHPRRRWRPRAHEGPAPSGGRDAVSSTRRREPTATPGVRRAGRSHPGHAARGERPRDARRRDRRPVQAPLRVDRDGEVSEDRRNDVDLPPPGRVPVGRGGEPAAEPRDPRRPRRQRVVAVAAPRLTVVGGGEDEPLVRPPAGVPGHGVEHLADAAVDRRAPRRTPATRTRTCARRSPPRGSRDRTRRRRAPRAPRGTPRRSGGRSRPCSPFWCSRIDGPTSRWSCSGRQSAELKVTRSGRVTARRSKSGELAEAVRRELVVEHPVPVGPDPGEDRGGRPDSGGAIAVSVIRRAERPCAAIRSIAGVGVP